MRAAERILTTTVHPWTTEETLEHIATRLDGKVFTQHGVINVAKLVKMRDDPELLSAVENCDIINADGMGIVWGARFLGLRIPERVAGVDLFFDLLALAERRGESVFFLGAREVVIEKTAHALAARYPRLKIAGWHHGYFREREEEVVDAIRASGARLLFVGMSSPMKEKFIDAWRDRLGVDFAMGVGGTFDIVAGKTRRAPPWMQRAGLEWFYRLLQEPRRMWRRYLVTNARFALLLVRAKLAATRRRRPRRTSCT